MEVINMDENVKYFLRETGGIVKLENDVTVYSLDLNGDWILNQYLIGMFIDGINDYKEITSEEVEEIIKDRKSFIEKGRSR